MKSRVFAKIHSSLVENSNPNRKIEIDNMNSEYFLSNLYFAITFVGLTCDVQTN